MNIQEYISSGVLESYVMGELSDKEMRKVQCMSLVHDEISKELKKIEVSFEMLAMDTAVQPSGGLKESIWTDIQKNSGENKTPVVSINPPKNEGQEEGSFNWARAASVAAIIGLAVFGWKGYSENQTLTSELDAQKQESAQFDSRMADMDKRLAQVNDEFAIMSSASYVPIRMKGTDNAPQALAQVYWNASSSEVYLSVAEMAALPEGKVYQLWALDDGVPVDAGTFKPDSTGLLKMKNISSGQAFAVTIENEGGSVTPALETLQVIGNVPV